MARPASSTATSTVTLCFCAALIEGFDIQSMGVAAPHMAPALGLDHDQLGLAFSGPLLAAILLSAGAGESGVLLALVPLSLLAGIAAVALAQRPTVSD